MLTTLQQSAVNGGTHSGGAFIRGQANSSNLELSASALPGCFWHNGQSWSPRPCELGPIPMLCCDRLLVSAPY